jgi:hypothetical protein
MRSRGSVLAGFPLHVGRSCGGILHALIPWFGYRPYFAEAASLEERLADACEEARLVEKSFVHRFSAGGCWAQAGDFYHANRICDTLLGRADLPERLRVRVQDYAHVLRQRRSEWYSSLPLDAAREA